MIHVDQEFTHEVECEYKGEKYRVRNNGAILREVRNGKPKRAKDEIWTFGEKIENGYAKFCGEAVHRIVAFAFLGEPPTNQHVVDHIDTNRQNNRPENLRWLTKLENILLNPITRKKIENLCGSVESFLKDPSQLRNHENVDKNLMWMRAVSPEEAQNALINWKTFLNKPRIASIEKGNTIGEWIFENKQYNNENKLGSSQIPTDQSVTPTQDYLLPSNVLDTFKEREEIEVTKTEFMTALIKVCQNEGWQYKKYFKDEGWKADILIYIGNKRFAFSTYSTVSSAYKTHSLIKEDNIKFYGIVLSPKKEIENDCTFFGLHNIDGALKVSIAGDNLTLEEFVKKVIEEKIIYFTSVKITSAEIIFPQISCYNCRTPHNVFVVRYLVDEIGDKYDIAYLDSYFTDENILPDLQFDQEFLMLVKKYIAEHPEKGIIMGDVKERYSYTMNQSYISFGCPRCDGIVGSHYLGKIECDEMYTTDENLMNRIQLITPFDIPLKGWKVLK